MFIVYIMENGEIFDIAGEFENLEAARKYKSELDRHYPQFEPCSIYKQTEERIE